MRPALTGSAQSERLAPKVRAAISAVAAAAVWAASISTGAALADLPGTDGGPADRGCKPVLNDAYYVGATDMACSNARRVATKAIQGDAQDSKWNCTGVGSSFGHCHGRGPRKGKTAHWAVND